MLTRLSFSALILAALFVLATCRASPAATPTLPPSPTPPPTATPIPGERQTARVLHIVDGDTIAVELDGARYSVRYIGIDTPETHHPTEGADYWGYEATDANAALVAVGATVVLQRDRSEVDAYGRLLRYVWVGDTLVNAELVRMGLARVLFYEPDVLYQREVKQAEAEALAARRGLYGPVPTPPALSPALYKGTAWTTAPAGQALGLRYDAGRGEVETYLPSGLKVRVADAFWVPEAGQWWYWVGANGFNGWVTGEFVTRDAPAGDAYDLPVRYEAYDELTVVETAALHALPASDGEALGELTAGTGVQVTRLSWEPQADAWWLWVESTAGAGWLHLDQLKR